MGKSTINGQFSIATLNYQTVLRVPCLSWPLFILFFSSRIFFRLRPRSPTSLLDSNTQPVGKGHLWKSMPHISTFLALTPHSDKPQILEMVWFVACWIIRPCIGHWNYPRIVVVEGSFIQEKNIHKEIKHIHWKNMEKSYPLVIQHSYGKVPFLMGKSTINGHFQ